MGKDETGTLSALKALRKDVFAPQVADGKLVVVVPLDLLAWTQPMGTFVANASNYIDQTMKPAGKHLVIAGGATGLAKAKMAELGWTLTEGGDSQLMPNLPY
jgi:hypothetical protein